MTKNNYTNSPHLWDKLLNTNQNIFDSPLITKDRIKLASRYINKNANVLNLGSGQGFLERFYFGSKMETQVKEWISFDLSSNGLMNIKKRKYPILKCVYGNVINLPFRDNTFDRIYGMEILEHINKKIIRKVYSEVMRISRRDAFFIFSVPVHENVSLKNHPVGHVRKYVPNVFFKELEVHGFKVIKDYKLFAFNNLYYLKSILSKKLSIRRPNVLLVICQKS